MAYELRLGLRVLRLAPGFAVTAVVTLGLGIAVNTAMFSVVDRVLIRTVPYPEADRLVVIWNRAPALGYDRLSLAPGDFVDYRGTNRVFEEVAASRPVSLTLTGIREPEQLAMARVSSSLFTLLRVTPVAGRAFTADEDRPGGPRVAVMSARLAERLFGSARAAVGKLVSIASEPYDVVGVMPAALQFPNPDCEVWLPIRFGPSELRRGHNYTGIGRLKPGVTVDQAQADIAAIMQGIITRFPDTHQGMSAWLEPLQQTMVGDIRPALLVLLSAVGLVLLIACANVANLLLARASARHKDVALRLALGATRAMIVRQFLLESLPLGLVAGALGLVVAVGSLGALRGLMPAGVPGAAEIGVSARLFAFTLGASLLTCVLVALAPALRASKADVSQQLKDTARSTGDPGGLRLRNLLVIGEVALATVLLVSAGLLIESFRRMSEVDAGFRTSGIMTMEIALPGSTHAKPGRTEAFYRELLQRVEGLPGVRQAGLVNRLPLSGQSSSGPATLDSPDGTLKEIRDVGWRATSAHYFRAMGIPLLRGREFLDTDTATQPGVVIVDDLMAKAFWPNQEAIGKRLKLGGIDDSRAPWLTVVGVVRHIRHAALDSEAAMQLYWPFEQRAEQSMVLVVQADGDPRGLVTPVRSQILAIDPNQPVSRVATMDQVLSQSLASRRFTMILLGVFAVLALVLAALGISSIMAYVVSLRTREMGVRFALGASRADVLTLILREVLKLTLAGLAVGFIGAGLATRLLTRLLYGVSATDPIVLGLVFVLLFGVALAGGLVPALRAARTSAMVALRSE
jgi:predicted permease